MAIRKLLNSGSLQVLDRFPPRHHRPDLRATLGRLHCWIRNSPNRSCFISCWANWAFKGSFRANAKLDNRREVSRCSFGDKGRKDDASLFARKGFSQDITTFWGQFKAYKRSKFDLEKLLHRRNSTRRPVLQYGSQNWRSTILGACWLIISSFSL